MVMNLENDDEKMTLDEILYCFEQDFQDGDETARDTASESIKLLIKEVEQGGGYERGLKECLNKLQILDLERYRAVFPMDEKDYIMFGPTYEQLKQKSGVDEH